MSLQYLVHFTQQEFMEIIYYNTRVQSAIIKQQNENKHLAKMIQGSGYAHQKILHTRATPQAAPTTGVK